jgi:hypothetical protein
VLTVFGLAALVPLVVMILGSGWLLLDGDGFEYRTSFKSRRSRWRNTGNFGTGKIPPETSISSFTTIAPSPD